MTFNVLATQTILWFCELTLDVCSIQIHVLCPYTVKAAIATVSHDLSSIWTIFTNSFSCPFLSCPIPACISVPKLPHCPLCVHCSLHLMMKTCFFLFELAQTRLAAREQTRMSVGQLTRHSGQEIIL